MTRYLMMALTAVLTVMSSTSAFSSTYSCVNREGQAMRIKKASTKTSFKLKLDDGDVYNCQRARASQQSGGVVRGEFYQRRLPDGDIFVCNRHRCYYAYSNNPFTNAGDI